MKLSEIVDAARLYLDRATDGAHCADDGDTALLIACANFALATIAEYIPLVASADVVAENGAFALTELPHRATKIKSVRKDGRAVAFRCRVADCVTDEDGVLTVDYLYAPPKAQLCDDCAIAPSVSAKTAAFCALAEYCAIVGMPETAEKFGEKFEQDIRAASRPQRELRLPERSWY